MFAVLIFVALASVSFGTMAIVLAPGKEQKAYTQRLGVLLAPGETLVIPDNTLLRVTEARTDDASWLNLALQGTGIPQRLSTLLLQSNVTTRVDRLLTMVLLLAVAGGGGCYLFAKNAVFAVASAAFLGYLPIFRLQFKRNQRIKAFEKALPDCIELCARSLRAGHSLVGAIGQVAEESEQPARDEFAEVFRRQNYGLPLRDALLEMMERVPSADLRVAVTGILVQKDTGGNLAEIMDRISEVIRERVRIKGEIGVHTAQGRLTGYILCALPPLLLLAINVISPGYSTLLFHEEIGHELLLAGVGLLALGWFLIRKIINGIEV